MRKFIVLLFCLFLAGYLTSCGPAIPTKELEDAKTSIERAKSVDAPVFAPQIYQEAQTDYDQANKFVDEKKNKEAKDMAVSSKDKADQSYETAREKRADDVFQKCSALMDTAVKQFAEKTVPEKYDEAKKEFDSVKNSMDNKDFDTAFTNGNALRPKLQELVDITSAEIEKAKNAIASAQDKYDAAESNDMVKDYALDDLHKALPVIDQARNAENDGMLKDSEAKAQEAEGIIDEAVKKAGDEYQKYLAKIKSDEDAAALAKQKELDAQKQKASEYIQEAKQKLEELKARQKKTSLLDIKYKDFSFNVSKFSCLSQDASASDNNTNEAEALPNDAQNSSEGVEPSSANTDVQQGSEMTNIEESSKPETSDVEDQNYTIETVESFIKKAEDSFTNEEYLDSIDFAREAIRIADILLAVEEEKEEAQAESNAAAAAETNIVQAPETNTAPAPALSPAVEAPPVVPPKEEVLIYVVKLNIKRRDCLWRIAGYMYNNKSYLWPVIWKANKEQIKDPDLIYPGQRLKIPPVPAK